MKRIYLALFLLFALSVNAQVPISAGMPVDGSTVVIGANNQISAVVPPQKSYVYPPTGNAASGFNVTVPSGITIFIINANALLATGTVTLPASPSDGMPLTLECPKGLTLATVAANTGQALSNGFAITTFALNTPYRIKYSAINATWYPN